MKFHRLRHIAAGIVLAGAAFVGQNGAATAQPVLPPCPAPTKVPEIVSEGGRLRGTIVLRDGQEAVPATAAGSCVAQLFRFYQDKEPAPGAPPSFTLPQTGPTLRARLGDIVELTFLNQINTLNYGNSIDHAEKGQGCDTSTGGYPRLRVGADAVLSDVSDSMPNCFHGSSTGNLHFHGTHTSPTSTGDNVFLGVRPSPRDKGVPTVTGASVKADFDTFFRNCEQQLRANNLNQWPVTWKDMPNTWTMVGPQSQRTLLQAYDKTVPADQALWPIDQKQYDQGLWPQYSMGSFPYCFVLPRYSPTGQVRMGQAPGTQWYHAHKHGSTFLNVSNGMAGAFIIEGDDYDGKLNVLYNQFRTDRASDWTRQQPTLVVNQIGSTPHLERRADKATAFGPVAAFSVNGVPNPVLTMYPGEVQMWRIVNASSVSGFWLPALPTGFEWRQLAQDGVQFDDGNYQTRAQRPVFVAAGNRIDLLVRAPILHALKGPTPADKTAVPEVLSFPVQVQQAVSVARAVGVGQGAAAPTTLLTVNVTGRGAPMPLMRTAPPRPTFLKDIDAGEVTNRRDLVFASTGAAGIRQHTINGAKFDPETPLKIDRVNTVEEWTIYNTKDAAGPGTIDHPFHIHINPFQVTEVFSPNAPLLNTQGQVVLDSTNKALPLYVIAPTQPVLVPGQCWLNPNNTTTWKPCDAPGGPPSARTNIWWDVFPIPAAGQYTPPKPAEGAAPPPIIIPGYFKMRSRFVDYGGSYVMHCHILPHEDRGMMMSVEVGPSHSQAFQHH